MPLKSAFYKYVYCQKNSIEQDDLIIAWNSSVPKHKEYLV